MSEENTTATTEAVSESPAKESDQNSSIDSHIAESKKYRKRAQEAEARAAMLEKKIANAEKEKLEKKEEYKTLYEQSISKLESLEANANKWSKYEEAKRNSLLEMHPEEDRESLSSLNLETLEYVTNKINEKKPNAPEAIGVARKSDPDLKLTDFANMTKKEKQEKWQTYMKQYKK
jgi:hypothetical protein